MSGFGNKRQEIESLKLRIEAQRQELGGYAHALIPGTKALATTGKSLAALRYLMPVLKPLAVTLLPRLWVRRKTRKLLIFGSIAGIAICLWQQRITAK